MKNIFVKPNKTTNAVCTIFKPTAIKYDALRYGRTASEGGYEFTVWVGEMGNYEGMISIESTTNEPMEIMFPKRQSTKE